jgi:hypothetical protein
VVAPPPNLTRLSGTILARRPHETLPDWDAVVVAVDGVSPIDGMRDLVGPNIARTASGTGSGDSRPEVVVAVRRQLLGDASPGWHLTCRVKLTPSGPMAEPHPAGGDFILAPPSATLP